VTGVIAILCSVFQVDIYVFRHKSWSEGGTLVEHVKCNAYKSLVDVGLFHYKSIVQNINWVSHQRRVACHLGSFSPI
jgi:hypothetical protein